MPEANKNGKQHSKQCKCKTAKNTANEMANDSTNDVKETAIEESRTDRKNLLSILHSPSVVGAQRQGGQILDGHEKRGRVALSSSPRWGWLQLWQ